MRPSFARLSKASRAPMTAKMGSKDYFKGNRQSTLPGSKYTGAPGRHVVRGKAKYILDDTKVRVFVAPPPEVLAQSPLKAYASSQSNLNEQVEKRFLKGRRALTGQNYLLKLRMPQVRAATREAQQLPPISPPQ